MRVRWRILILCSCFFNLSALVFGQDLSHLERGSACIIENRGQVDQRDFSLGAVRYYAHLNGIDVYFCDAGFSYVYSTRDSGQTRIGVEKKNKPGFRLHRLDLRFLNSGAITTLKADKRLAASFHFQRAHLRTSLNDLPAFEELSYLNVFPGVDLRFHLVNGALKYDYLVHPGADPSNIKLQVEQAERVEINVNGQLVFKKSNVEVKDDAPIAWQQSHSHPQESVPVRFALSSTSIIGYELYKDYDKSRELVIDPAITWSTFLGGRKTDEINDVCLDHQGRIVLCGNSESDVFPGTLSNNKGNYDYFISIFNPAGALISTLYGGSIDLEIANAVSVDASDNIFICGSSLSYDLGFANNVFQAFNSNTGYSDAFIAKFNSSLRFTTGTFIGGGSFDEAFDLAIDGSQNVVVVGYSRSDNFPTVNARYSKRGGVGDDDDAFLSKWSNGLSCLWSTYYGGTSQDRLLSVTTEPIANSNIYVGGFSVSPRLPDLNGFQQTNRGLTDALVGVFSPSGSPIVITLCGALGYDEIKSIVVRNDSLLVCGLTDSGSKFPAFSNVNAYDHSGNIADAFVALFDRNLRGKWSTLWGGGENEYFSSMCINVDGTIVCAGFTNSKDLPTKRPLQANHGNFLSDLLLCKFSPDGSNIWATAVGGVDSESPRASVCVDKDANMYLVGNSLSGDFPLVKAVYPQLSGEEDGVLLKICPTTPVVNSSSPDTLICDGTVVRLTADPGLTNVVWSTAETTPFIDIKSAGYYSYVATSVLGCRANSDTIHIVTQSKVPATIQSRGRTKLCPGDSVLLFTREKFDGYSWRDQNDVEIGKSDSLYVKSPGSYYLRVLDLSGCRDRSVSVTITAATKPLTTYSALIDSKTLIDTVRQSLLLCEGQQVELRIGLGTKYFVYWSNGASGQVLNPSVSGSYVAFITDSSNCLWQMDTVSIVFAKRAPLAVAMLDSVCTGETVLVSTPFIASSIRYQWLVDGGTILGSQDSNVVRVQWSTSGLKTVRVVPAGSSVCADTGLRTIFVQSSLVGGISAPGGLELCEGASLTLKAPAGYAHYFWNNTPGLDSYQATFAGVYHLRFDNGKGCEGIDSVRIVPAMSYSVGKTVLDFDTIMIGQRSQLRFVVRNSSSSPLRFGVNALAGASFEVDSVSPLMNGAIPSGDSAWVYVHYLPANALRVTDSLVIRLIQPCADSFFVALQGVGRDLPSPPVVRFRLQDTELDPLGSPVSIPVQVWLEPTTFSVPRIDSVFFLLDYAPQMMRIRSTTNGLITNSYKPATQRMEAFLRVAVDSLSSDPKQICVLEATVLLGDRMLDSMIITSCAVFPQMPSVLEVEKAELKYTNICASGGLRLLGEGSSMKLALSPNPVFEHVHVECSSAEKGLYRLFIHDIHGSLRWTREWNSLLGAVQEFDFGASDFESGSYVFTFQGPTEIARLPVLIIR